LQQKEIQEQKQKIYEFTGTKMKLKLMKQTCCEPLAAPLMSDHTMLLTLITSLHAHVKKHVRVY
jgi:hypothetical protein